MNRIKELREERDWTQEKLGSMIQVQKSAISKYEQEKISLTQDIILQLTDIFKVSADYLIGISNIKKETTQNERSLNRDEEEALTRFRNQNEQNMKKTLEYMEFLKDKEL